MEITGNDPTAPPQRLAVLGAGPIGRIIGRRWVEAGHPVAFGSRTPSALAEFVHDLGPLASAHGYRDAAASADVVLLAVASEGVESVLAEVSGVVLGKILINATNHMGVDEDGRIVSTLPDGTTEGSHAADQVPGVRVVRAFSHVMDELLESRGIRQPMFWAMAVAGDDPDAVDQVAELVSATGFSPVRIGSLAESEPLDPGGVLFPHLFTPADLAAALTPLDALMDIV